MGASQSLRIKKSQFTQPTFLLPASQSSSCSTSKIGIAYETAASHPLAVPEEQGNHPWTFQISVVLRPPAISRTRHYPVDDDVTTETIAIPPAADGAYPSFPTHPSP